jgi:hypothetical protein
MKKIIVLLFLTMSFVSYSQEETIPQLKPYEDLASKLYSSKVIEIAGKTQKELQNNFKNWASTSFNNLREVMVSETDNQIVLVYITKEPALVKTIMMTVTIDRSWYVRLVAEFKEGKMRVSIYDDGNVFQPGEYSQYGSVPAVQARTQFVSSFQTAPTNPKDLMRSKGTFYNVHYKWQQKANATLLSIEEAIKNPTVTSPKRKDDF